MIIFFWLSFVFFLLGAFCSARARLSFWAAGAGAVTALITGTFALLGDVVFFRFQLTGRVQLVLGLDHLTGIFLIIAAISWLALSVYSVDYSKLYPQKRIALGFNLCLLGMMIILSSRDGISLLIGWEIMTIFAFLMMLAQGRNFEQAYRFLAFGELSTAFLVIGYALLYKESGNVGFESLRHGGFALLVLLSLGFIIKMDIVPFHGWMKGIYGEIPDNVAAMLSAPVTLMGVYGMERIIPLIPKNETWNIILVLIGALSAFWGALQAVATNKLRLLPAYSTIENNGMILTAIGFYAIADGVNLPALHYLSLFALAASLVITLAHTLSKTLLFMSLGHAKEAYNVQHIDHARGVWSGVGKIPALGILVSALSFSAFPPLIGYAGEWMILETLFQSYRFPSAATEFLAAVAGVLIALAIGLIGFAMVKLIGYTALGYDHGRKSRRIPNNYLNLTQIVMLLLVALSGIGLPAVILWLGYPELLTGLLGIPKPFVLASGNPVFGVISPTFISIMMVVLIALPLLLFLIKRKSVRKVHSWNGGVSLTDDDFFTAPAYSQILEHILRSLYRTKEVRKENEGTVEVEDVMLGPMRTLTRWVQKIGEGEALMVMNGRISAYVSYILILFIIVFVIGVLAN